MFKKDGAWFGETVQGFFGWMIVTFIIVMSFQAWNLKNIQKHSSENINTLSLIPLLNYGSFIIFQMTFGTPVETRTIAFFAMGIPFLIAIVQWIRWKNNYSTHAN